MQKKGVELFRYTNRTSWAERDCRLAGRDDLWNVMIQDKVDGYQVWTAGVTGAYHRFRIGYGGSSEKAVHDFPPERQSTCQLLYIRKNGDFYKPVSCIRLEDMRDGITDYFYYRLAEKTDSADTWKINSNNGSMKLFRKESKNEVQSALFCSVL